MKPTGNLSLIFYLSRGQKSRMGAQQSTIQQDTTESVLVRVQTGSQKKR